MDSGLGLGFAGFCGGRYRETAESAQNFELKLGLGFRA